MPSPAPASAPLPTNPSPGTARVVGGRSDPQGGPGPWVMSAESLTGERVENPAGENLGEAKAIMIDVPSGRVAYVVLSFGGFLGLGDKLFAIPWAALTLDADRKRFVLNVDKELLRNAPGFDKDRWPSMADPSFANTVHRYYGVEPYWRGGTTQP